MTKARTDLQSHPAASFWPMLPEPDLRRLADDIQANGLRHPIVLDQDGLILDGRNRYAACKIAGVEPLFETYDGADPVAYILSANNERRHLSLPQRAAATALTLAQDGRRKGGKWDYGTVSESEPNGKDLNRSSWKVHMAHAGTVLDHCPELLPKVAVGEVALDAAVKEATEIRKDKEQRKDLPNDLGALVDAGELSMGEALRRAALPPDYRDRVASGAVTLAEAEHLNAEEQREYRAAIQRSVTAIDTVLALWPAVAGIKHSGTREDILAALSDYSRAQYIELERETTWPTRKK